MAEEKKVYSRTKGIVEGAVSGFCPGCMHSTIHKLIGEAAEELGQLDKLVRVEGVGCCGLGQFYVTCDETIAAHGRAGAVATGIKRSSPDSLVKHLCFRHRLKASPVCQADVRIQGNRRIIQKGS